MANRKDSNYEELIKNVTKLLKKYKSYISHNETSDPHINHEKRSGRINTSFEVQLNDMIENFNQKYSTNLDSKKVLSEAEGIMRKVNKEPSAKNFKITEIIELKSQNKIKNI